MIDFPSCILFKIIFIIMIIIIVIIITVVVIVIVRVLKQPRRRRQQERHKFAYSVWKWKTVVLHALHVHFSFFHIPQTFSFFSRREMTCFAVVWRTWAYVEKCFIFWSTGSNLLSVMTWNNWKNDCRSANLHFQVTLLLSTTLCLLRVPVLPIFMDARLLPAFSNNQLHVIPKWGSRLRSKSLRLSSLNTYSRNVKA